MKGILGRKVGMTQVFATSGKLIPVTVIEVEDNVITQIKTLEKDGYNSIQLGTFDKREKVSNKPEMGHVKKAKTNPKRFLKEIKNLDVSGYEVGQVIKADIFEPGELVDVTGISKGKGFQGVIKRWNFSRGPMGHGSHFHRRPGSRGTLLAMKVLKGRKLPGHMGNEQITIQNLEVISVDIDNNYILVSGNIPGPKNSYVLVRSAVKGGKRKSQELVTYVIEEPKEEKEVIEENKELESKPENIEEVKETKDNEEKKEIENNKEENKETETNKEETPQEVKDGE